MKQEPFNPSLKETPVSERELKYAGFVYFGSHIFLLLSIVGSVIRFSDIDAGLPGQREFSILSSLIPFAISAALISYGTYVNMSTSPIKSNSNALSVLGAVLSGTLTAAAGFGIFMFIKTAYL